jgi:hypothetical protein
MDTRVKPAYDLGGASKYAYNFRDFHWISLFHRGKTMTSDKDKALPPEFSKAEHLSPQWQFQFLDTKPIDAGEMIVPAKLSGDLAREFAELHMIRTDFSFALDCLKESDKLGLPDSENLHSKALIFSAVVAYARPFKTGVRALKMDAGYFSNLSSFNVETHDYLIAVRDKHIVHSVNDFERSDATGVMVGTPQTKWRPAGVGVTMMQTIGLSRRIVEQAIVQLTDMRQLLTDQIDRIRPELFQVFCAEYARDGKWEMVPMAQNPNRGNAQKRRT